MHSEAICELSGCRLFYECLRLLHNTSSPFTPSTYVVLTAVLAVVLILFAQ